MVRSINARGEVERIKCDLEAKLLDGSFPANSRLPTERELKEEYKVARNTIREAIQRLIAIGWLRSKPGAGVFVVNQLRTSISPFEGLVTNHPNVGRDIPEFRRVLEGAAAYFAAQRAEADDIEQIQNWLSKLEESRNTNDLSGEASADVEFHKAIAKASHNIMFLHLQTSIISMLREHITLSGMDLRERDSTVSKQLLIQHQVICKAICAKQPDEARTAMHAHIDFVRNHVKSIED